MPINRIDGAAGQPQDAELGGGRAALFVADREAAAARRVHFDVQSARAHGHAHFAARRRVRLDQSSDVPHRLRTGERHGARV